MQIIEYSKYVENIINLSMVAKEYYELLCNRSDNHLYKKSIEYVKERKYNISNGVKERCINLIDETINKVNDSEAFYQYLLANISCNKVEIESLYNMFVDMLHFCHKRIQH